MFRECLKSKNDRDRMIISSTSSIPLKLKTSTHIYSSAFASNSNERSYVLASNPNNIHSNNSNYKTQTQIY